MPEFKSHEVLTLTVAEKLGFVLVIANALGASAMKYITSTFYRPSTYPSKAVLVESQRFRSVLARSNTRMHQTQSPPSCETYKLWLKEKAQKGYAYAAEDIASEGMETRLLWVGEPWKRGDTKKKVLLYFHGGGYIVALGKGHLSWMKFMKEQVGKYGEDVSIAVLEYYVAPQKKFPTQLHQAVLALNHLIAAGCSPSNIAIGGDSAGGNLSLAILSHYLHPHPQVPKLLEFSTPLAAALLISPWVTVATSSDSFERNKSFDLIVSKLADYWAIEAMGEGVAAAEVAAGRYHAEALLAPESWWKGLDSVVNFVVTTGGAFETFIDDIVEFDHKLKAQSGVKTELYVAAQEVHDGPLFDFTAGRPPSELAIKLTEFLEQGFRAKS
ncbi:Alpha/Beta hydrolase protein [Sphaerosporella brunnea]|uniref:Alpha/Beta hydrolase protein n=1 Tax=Sphaerosporella brunnea TaxID=1250544 RepID=A0A5J5EPY6_9PEZI|nr:Alpha/Beta hydrolase protein [Sphaerosporella brunnea]